MEKFELLLFNDFMAFSLDYSLRPPCRKKNILKSSGIVCNFFILNHTRIKMLGKYTHTQSMIFIHLGKNYIYTNQNESMNMPPTLIIENVKEQATNIRVNTCELDNRQNQNQPQQIQQLIVYSRGTRNFAKSMFFSIFMPKTLHSHICTHIKAKEPPLFPTLLFLSNTFLEGCYSALVFMKLRKN